MYRASLGLRVVVAACLTSLFAACSAESSHDDASPGGAPPEAVASGIVMTPAGPRAISDVHVIPSGTTLERDGTVRRFGEVVKSLHIDTAPTPTVPIPPAAVNWVAWVQGTAPADQSITGIAADFVVPPAPADDGQLIYFFPSTDSNVGSILQPVLQYGYNGFTGGSYWSLASYFVSNGNAGVAHSDPIRVNAGDLITTSTRLVHLDGSTQYWTVSATDTATHESVTNTFDVAQPASFVVFNRVESGVLEAYRLKGCGDYPGGGRIEFVNVNVTAGTLSSPTPFTPKWLNYFNANESAQGYPQNCGFGADSAAGAASLTWGSFPAPYVADVTPREGWTGQTVTLEGGNFDTNGVTRVSFGGVPSPSVTCATSASCVAVVPAGSGAVALTVSVNGESASAGQYTFVPPPPAPGCKLTSTCNDEYFPPGFSSQAGYHTMETVSGGCASTPSVIKHKAGSDWASLPAFTPSAGYPETTTPGVFVIGAQSAGQTTAGAPIGSVESVTACATNAGGTTCDPPTTITIANCCHPLQCDGSLCGRQSDGCGGFIDCTCGVGLVCDTRVGMCADGVNPACPAQRCPAGMQWSSSDCTCTKICHSPACACAQAGGEWNGHSCS